VVLFFGKGIFSVWQSREIAGQLQIKTLLAHQTANLIPAENL
jgi:hypothetical protein